MLRSIISITSGILASVCVSLQTIGRLSKSCNNAGPRSILASLGGFDASITTKSILNVHFIICALVLIHGIKYLLHKIETKKIMDKFLSRKRTFDDNKASTSAQTSIVFKIKSRKYSQEYLNFGFTITEVNGEEKPLCFICSKILAADGMQPNKLKRHFETLHGYQTSRVLESKYHKIARCNKPHTIAEELILPSAIEIVETMFGDNFAKELQSIPLLNDTVSRRLDDIPEDVEQQRFGKLRDKLFQIQIDEAT
ncbi:protein ZBED8 [Trichonephila clavipes]|uniref:Protein ZBED8 n=1 Tax=Trichonephila clavipes TaxID=2585209 RepID=A0A8X6T0Y1_TRICX|nr:protein ZBED8 [Trichonephila clavipes]